MLHRFYEVSKIITAENALRILKEIRENINAQAYLNSFFIFIIYNWLDSFLIEPMHRPEHVSLGVLY
jgi:hypothetical protein